MSQKKIYNYLNIVKNYTHLSDSQFVQNFLDYLKRFVVSEGFTAQQLESSKSCFIIAENMKQALFLISLCFGGRQIANEFFKHMADKRSHQDLLMKLKSFACEGTPLQIFETNAKLYGSQYPFYRKNIIDLLTEEQCWQMFIKAKQSINLHGVKIRKWPEFYQKRNSFKKLTREFEEDEVKLKGDTTYLYIGGEQNLVVGMINCNAEIQTELDNSRKLNECELPIENQENLKAKTNNKKKQSATNQQSERKLFKPSQQSKNFRSQTQLVAQNINKNMSTNESIIQKDEGKPSALLKCKQFLKRCLFCCCQ